MKKPTNIKEAMQLTQDLKLNLDPIEILDFIETFYGESYSPLNHIVLNYKEDANYSIGDLIKDCIKKYKRD